MLFSDYLSSNMDDLHILICIRCVFCFVIIWPILLTWLWSKRTTKKAIKSMTVWMALNFGHQSRGRMSKIFDFGCRLRPTVQHCILESQGRNTKLFSFVFGSNENFILDLPTFSSYDFPGEVVQMTSLVRPFAKGWKRTKKGLGQFFVAKLCRSLSIQFSVSHRWNKKKETF